MIKLKSLIKEAHAWERKFGEKLPTLASVQKKKLKEEINKLTEKLSKSEIKKMRDKFNKTGKLPPHLKKLADLMDKHKEVEDIVVPGLEWMNDIPEGVVKGEEVLKEGWTNVKFDDVKVGTKITYQMKVVYIVTKLYPGGFLMKIYKSGDNPGMFAPKARIEKDNYESQVKMGFIKGVK